MRASNAIAMESGRGRRRRITGRTGEEAEEDEDEEEDDLGEEEDVAREEGEESTKARAGARERRGCRRPTGWRSKIWPSNPRTRTYTRRS